jgi:hypothetical protein
VGSIPALAEYNITDVLVSFKKSRPQSILNIVQGGSIELKEMLRQRKCEIAFIRFSDDMDDDLVKVPYTVDSMVAVLPPTHPLAKQKTIPLRMLADENFVLSEKQTMLYKLSIYPKIMLSRIWEQAMWTKASQFSDFLHQRVATLRRFDNQLKVLSTTQRLAGKLFSPGIGHW